MLLPAFIGFLMGFLGAIPIAGPVSALVLHHGLKLQIGRGIALAAGAALAEAIYVFMAFQGFNLIFTAYPQLDLISKWVGSLILISLGFYFLFQKHSKTTVIDPGQRNEKKRNSFFFGFTVSVLNPTLMVTWTTLIASIHAYHWFEYNKVNSISFSTGVAIGIVSWFLLMLIMIRKLAFSFEARLVSQILKLIGMALVITGIYGILRAIHLTVFT